MAERAREGLRAGYACFKVKVGLPEDAERVAAVRDAVGPWPALRVDANRRLVGRRGGRVHPRARAATTSSSSSSPAARLEELRQVRGRVSTPIAADESVGSARAVRRAVELEACDVVNVKLAERRRLQGRRARPCALARAKGLGAFLSSTLDGPWGIAAALQLAAAEDLQLACGLATLELFDAPLARALPAPRNGTLRVPGGPGLGVEVDEGALAEVSSTSSGLERLAFPICSVAQLTADLAARVGLAVDVGVGHAGADARAPARRTPSDRCPGRAGRSRRPA